MISCKPKDREAWLEWHAIDPEAALAFLGTLPPEPEWTVWDDLAECESGGNWQISTGNGYYGGLQFLLSTWRAAGGEGYPHENSREEQIRIATILRDSGQGYDPWPACGRKLGLR